MSEETNSTPNEESKPVEQKSPNYKVGSVVFKGLIKGAPKLALPSAPASELEKKQDQIGTIVPKDLGSKGEKWAEALTDSMSFWPAGKAFEKAVADPAAQFENSPVSEANDKLSYRTARKITRSGELSGSLALNAVAFALGQNYSNLVPFWHSGFWVNFRTPSADQQLELFRRLNVSKVLLGRDSYGLAFSNSTVYRNEIVLRFFFEELLESCSLKLPDEETDYLKYLKIPDSHSVFTYLAASIFPNGFNFDRACTSDPGKCTHVVSESLDLSALPWVDMSKISKAQRRHMENSKPGSMTVESVQRYQDEFLIMKRSTIAINDALSVVISTPSCLDQITAGRNWIDSISNDYPEAMFEEADQRNAFIINKGKATKARQYGHYVESIHIKFDDIEQTIVDKDTIANALTTISNNSDDVEKFIKNMVEYISNNNVAFTAIPSYKCPACGGMQVDGDNETNPELIVLDPMRLFFILMQPHIRSIMSRE